LSFECVSKKILRSFVIDGTGNNVGSSQIEIKRVTIPSDRCGNPDAVAFLHIILGDVSTSGIGVGDTRKIDQDGTGAKGF
jgi:hypothetical protein